MKPKISFLEFFIALRYMRGREGNLLSMNAFMALMGVFLGPALLVVVLSIGTGFQTQMKESIFNFDPHIVLSRTDGGKESPIRNWKSIRAEILTRYQKEIVSAEGAIQSPGILKNGSLIDHVFIRAVEFPPVDPQTRQRSFPASFPEIVQPTKTVKADSRPGVYIGQEMAVNLGIYLGETIELVVPRGQFSLQAGMTPSMKSFPVIGFFKTGYYEYDSKVILMELSQGQKLFSIGDAVQQIDIRIQNPDQLSIIRNRLYIQWPWNIHSLEEQHQNLFAALKLEKTIMTIIIFLFTLAGIMGIVIATWNLVRSHKKDIGIAKALGMSDHSILMIFTFTGFLLGAVGSILGIVTGIYLSLHVEDILGLVETGINTTGNWIAQLTGGVWLNISVIPKGVYYFDHIPVHIDIPTLGILGIVAVFLSGLASMIPAWAASRYEPVSIIRGGEQ